MLKGGDKEAKHSLNVSKQNQANGRLEHAAFMYVD
jgi:hypothetical protein